MPSELNPKLNQFNLERKPRSAAAYLKDILAGNRVTLSQAITLVESTFSAHQQLAREIIEACLPYSGKSQRIGITGSPGVGKSTFIEASGLHLIETYDRRVAVLAIDPSSQINKGSILGDKTRMEKLSRAENAFIRPSAAGETLGGVARKTRESIILCEAAGYDTIFIETVGVGQSEIAVHSMVDCFLLLLLPGAGDELQGIKRGIVEMADIVIINKADGDRINLAKTAKMEYRNALHLFPPKSNDWISKIHLCSALEREGLQEIWKTVYRFFSQMRENDFLEKNRKKQATYWLHDTLENSLKNWFYHHPQIQKQLPNLQQQVNNQKISPFYAAEQLLKIILRDF